MLSWRDTYAHDTSHGLIAGMSFSDMTAISHLPPIAVLINLGFFHARVLGLPNALFCSLYFQVCMETLVTSGLCDNNGIESRLC